ncbi:hypothetical protein FCV25MIE_28922 [Fagus crenata]
MLPIQAAPTTKTMPAADNAGIVQNEPAEVNADVATAYMQTIEDGPRGEELELDNNPQAPVLQQPEY